MRKLLLLPALLFEMFFPLCGNICAASNNQQLDRNQVYELRDRCRSSAEDFFKIIYKRINKETTGASYKYHYNAIVNKCFFILTRDKMDENGNFSTKQLFDFNDCELLGTFSRDKHNNIVHGCNVLEKICHSEAEWDALVKPYMEK